MNPLPHDLQSILAGIAQEVAPAAPGYYAAAIGLTDIVQCRKCLTKNRIKDARVKDAICGRCKERL